MDISDQHLISNELLYTAIVGMATDFRFTGARRTTEALLEGENFDLMVRGHEPTLSHLTGAPKNNPFWNPKADDLNRVPFVGNYFAHNIAEEA